MTLDRNSKPINLRKSRIKQTLLLTLLASIAVAVLLACSKGEARSKSAKSSHPVAPGTETTPDFGKRVSNVKVVQLVPSSLTEYTVAHGVTQAIRDVTYSAEIPGKIEYLSAELGDRIRIGQVLARIDFQTLKAQADQAQSHYDLAKTTFERLSALRNEELISQQQIDEARSNMQASQAQLAIAKANLSKSTIRASQRGIVSAKYIEKAEYVGPGTQLYQVVDYRTIIVEAMLAETQVAGIQKNASVEIHISALNQDFQGEVDTIIPTADQASKTFKLRVKIDNPQLHILVGMSATVRIAAKIHKDVLVVPQSVVIESPKGRFVFVVDGDTVSKRNVQLGAVQEDRVVLLEGVSEGESLVVLGQRDLTGGQRVRIVP